MEDADVAGTSTKTDKKKSGALKLPALGDCQICHQKAHGIHFGVLACRACAAFFRRSVVSSSKYQCRMASGVCDISEGERYICRKCRYNKCLEKGMTPENVQWNRDSIASARPKSKSKLKPRKPRSETSSEDNVSDNVPHMDSDSPPSISREMSDDKDDAMSDTEEKPSTIDFDVEQVIIELKRFTQEDLDQIKQSKSVARLFESGRPPPSEIEIGFAVFKAYSLQKLRIVVETFDPEAEIPRTENETVLERMRNALRWTRRNQNPNPRILDKLDAETGKTIFSVNMDRNLKWFMFSDEFIKLPLDEKMAIFRHGWPTWQTLEKVDMSFQIFGERTITEKICVAGKDVALTDRATIDLTGVTDKDPEYIRDMLSSVISRTVEEVAEPLWQMKLTELEITYMLCQLAFHTEGKEVSDDSQKACVAFRNQVSDDLHNYYTQVMQQPNYANRLIKIMEIIHTIEDIHREKTKILDLARLFDITKINISDENLL